MSLWVKVRNAVTSFFTGTMYNFLKPFIDTIERNGGQILIAAAENAVQVGFATTGGGQAAMAAALKAFASQVASQGLPFIESQARAMIELALQRAKAAVPPVYDLPKA